MSLLSGIAEDRPLLCLFDDVQWFDHPSIGALLFAVRRMHAHPVAAIFAARDGEPPFLAPGLEALALPRLNAPDAALLAAARGKLAAGLVDRIVAESEGNPLAVIELTAHARAAPSVTASSAPLPAAGRLQAPLPGLSQAGGQAAGRARANRPVRAACLQMAQSDGCIARGAG